LPGVNAVENPKLRFARSSIDPLEMVCRLSAEP
jgi:hypothetical protein